MTMGLLLFVCLAAPPPADNPLAAGRLCFERLDFECAVELLSAAARRFDPASLEPWIDVHRMLAESHLALGQREAAVLVFVKILKAKPDFQLPGTGTSPKILDAAAEARERLAHERSITLPDKGANSSQPWKPWPPPLPELPGIREEAPEDVASPVDNRFGLSLAAGCEFLFGQDRERLELGPVTDLVATSRWGSLGELSLGLRYGLHLAADSDANVQLAGGWLGAGVRTQWGPIGLSLAPGMGWLRFGIWGEEGRNAFFLPVRAAADLALGRSFVFGLAVCPAWIFTQGMVESSFTLSTQLTVGWTWGERT